MVLHLVTELIASKTFSPAVILKRCELLRASPYTAEPSGFRHGRSRKDLLQRDKEILRCAQNDISVFTRYQFII